MTKPTPRRRAVCRAVTWIHPQSGFSRKRRCARRSGHIGDHLDFEYANDGTKVPQCWPRTSAMRPRR